MNHVGSSSGSTQNIILDTCILQYTSNRHISSKLREYLIHLINAGFTLALSQISICELLSNTSAQKEKQGLSVINQLKQYKVDHAVLLVTSRLSTLYSLEKMPSSQITLGDQIIAATAILTGSLILTADIHDFPRPFFTEAEEKLIFYKKKNKTQMTVIQLLKPNIPVIKQRFSKRPQG